MILYSWPQQQQPLCPVAVVPNGGHLHTSIHDNDLNYSQFSPNQQQPQSQYDEYFDDEQYRDYSASTTSPSPSTSSTISAATSSVTSDCFSRTRSSSIENLSLFCSPYKNPPLAPAISLSQQSCCLQLPFNDNDAAQTSSQTLSQTLGPAPRIELFDDAQPYLGSQTSSITQFDDQQQRQQTEIITIDEFVISESSAYQSAHSDRTDDGSDVRFERDSCSRSTSNDCCYNSNDSDIYNCKTPTTSSDIQRKQNAKSALKYRARTKNERERLECELHRQMERKQKLENRFEQGLIIYQELLSMLTTSLRYNWTSELAEIAFHQLNKFRQLAPDRSDLWGQYSVVFSDPPQN